MEELRADLLCVRAQGPEDLFSDLNRLMIRACDTFRDQLVVPVAVDARGLTEQDEDFLGELAKSFAFSGLLSLADEDLVKCFSETTSLPRVLPQNCLRNLQLFWETTKRWLDCPQLNFVIRNSLPCYLALFFQMDHLEGIQHSEVAPKPPMLRIRDVPRAMALQRFFPLHKIAESTFVLSGMASRKVTSKRGKPPYNIRPWWFVSVLSELLTRLLGEESGVEAVLRAIHDGVPAVELEHWKRNGELASLLAVTPPGFKGREASWYASVVPQLLSLCCSPRKTFAHIDMERMSLETFSVMMGRDTGNTRRLLDDHVFLGMIAASERVRSCTSFSSKSKPLPDTKDLRKLIRLLTDGTSPLTGEMGEMALGMLDILGLFLLCTSDDEGSDVHAAVVKLTKLALENGLEMETRAERLVKLISDCCDIYYAPAERSLADRPGHRSETGVRGWSFLIGNLMTSSTPKDAVFPLLVLLNVSERLIDVCTELSDPSSRGDVKNPVPVFDVLASIYRSIADPVIDAETEFLTTNFNVKYPKIMDVSLALPLRLFEVAPASHGGEQSADVFPLFLVSIKFAGRLICAVGGDHLKKHGKMEEVNRFLAACDNSGRLWTRFNGETRMTKGFSDGVELLVWMCRTVLDQTPGL